VSDADEFPTPRSSDRTDRFSALAHALADTSVEAAALRQSLWNAARGVDRVEGFARQALLIEAANRLNKVAKILVDVAAQLRAEAGITQEIRAQERKRIRVRVVVMGMAIGVAAFLVGYGMH